MKKILSYDLPPFKAAVEAGVPLVMVGHLLYPTIDPKRPASLSPEAMKLLREEVGFDGLIITDDLTMEGAKRGGTVAQAAVKAISAGADMLLISGPPEEQADAYASVVHAVERGRVSRERINNSVERILRLKQQYRMQPTKRRAALKRQVACYHEVPRTLLLETVWKFGQAASLTPPQAVKTGPTSAHFATLGASNTLLREPSSDFPDSLSTHSGE